MMNTDQEVQEAILRELIEEFEEVNGKVLIGVNSIVENLDERESIDENEVRYNLDTLDSEFAIDHSPAAGGNGTIELKHRGILKYEDLSGEAVIPESHQLELLEELDAQKRDQPRNPALSRQELIDETSLTDGELDRAIWFMKEAGQVDALTSIGTPWWSNASIADPGRRILNRHR